jgi:hypothetical protein
MRMNRPPRPVVFIAGALFMAAVFAAVYVFAVLTRTGQTLDERAFDGARLGQRSLAPVTHSLLDSLPVVAIAVALVIALILSTIRRNWVAFFVAIAAALFANLATQFLKDIALDRPDLGVHGYALNSLPSGHTTLAASAALLVFLVSSPRMRPMVATIGAVFTIFAGVSTLANQWHRPSDVIAALLVVAFSGCIAGAALARHQPRVPTLAVSSWNRALHSLALVSLAIAALALIASALQSGIRPLSLPLAYVGGIAGISAVGFLLATAAAKLFRSFH